jgi:multiple sugar transport system permease protein
MDLWASSSTIIIFLAGLQGVPRELKEAVEVDGGNWWHKFWTVTIPHMTPYILFNTVLGIIGAFQTFTQSFIMTGGGPEKASLFLSLVIYRKAFSDGQMGMACAIAWILFMIIGVITFAVFKTSGAWVFYYGEKK